MKTAVMAAVFALTLVVLAGPQEPFGPQHGAPAGFDPQTVVRAVRRNRGLAETSTPAPGRPERPHPHRGRFTDAGEFLIDTSGALIAAPYYQESPALGFDGTNFLVVWQDLRTGSEYDIYGARVSPAGTVLDPQGFPISTADYNQRWPALGFDGTNFLVVWTDDRSGSDIYGARVSPAGTVLDPQGFPISTVAAWKEFPALAFDGTNYLVVWQDDRNGRESDIYGARVSPAGTVLDTQGIAISTAANIQRSSDIAFDGNNFLVVWHDARNSGEYDIYGARVSPAGTVLDTQGIAISTAANGQFVPGVGFDGANYLVVWADERSGGDIYGARVTPTGTVLDPQGIPISTTPEWQWYPALGFDGTNFLVAWRDDRSSSSGDIYGARVTPTGTVLDPQGFPISNAADWQLYPALGFGGSSFLVLWQDNRSSSWDIYGARVTPTGTVLDPQGITISTAAYSHYDPALGFDGNNFLAVWQDLRSGSEYDIYGARVTPTGTVLDPQGFPISTAGYHQAAPALGFDGTNYLIVWQDNRNGGDDDIYGARVSPTGTVLDPQGFPISTAADRQEFPALAFDGTNYLIVWQDRRDSRETDIYGARVTPTGTVLDPQGIAISTATAWQRYPALGFDGTNYLIVWQDNRNGGDDDIYGARVSPAGTVLDPQGFPISTAGYHQAAPALGSDGTNYLIVWQDNRRGGNYDIYGARVSPAGTVLDPQGIAISTATAWKEFPALAFDGTSFLVVWQDARHGRTSDIYGAQVSPAGTVANEDSVVIQEGSQLKPALVRGPGNWLFLVYQGWTGTFSGRTYNAYRIWGKLEQLTGLAELPRPGVQIPVAHPTIVRSLLVLNAPSTTGNAILIDASGRKVRELYPGANDVRQLAPGVYFVRQGSDANRVAKIMITR